VPRLCRWLAASAAIAQLTTVNAASPRAVSINLCADQLVISVAEPAQILSLSWLAVDPAESMLAAAAAQYPANYGTAEEVIRLHPDVVIAGTYTSTFTKSLLRRLGYRVVEVAPATSLDAIASNIRQVGDALGRSDRAETVVAAMRVHMHEIDERARGESVAAVVVRPGGFTIERESLAHDILAHAGFHNIAAESGLDRWGSLSMEALLRARAELIVINHYRPDAPSLANGVLAHPALAAAAHRATTTALPVVYWACGLPESLASSDALLDAYLGKKGARVSTSASR
jgi:iron complex transport system substrate-binding protein